MWYTIGEERKVQAHEKLIFRPKVKDTQKRFGVSLENLGEYEHGGATHYINRSRNFRN